MYEQQRIIREIVAAFEALVLDFERAIEALAHDDSGTGHIDALLRAKAAAMRGIEVARRALPED